LWDEWQQLWEPTRRVFASEHLNNNTPVHVIQALLGHATLDTVMVYAKLYPEHMVDEYRKALCTWT
jgi:site-specific recombinase XerD